MKRFIRELVLAHGSNNPETHSLRPLSLSLLEQHLRRHQHAGLRREVVRSVLRAGMDAGLEHAGRQHRLVTVSVAVPSAIDPDGAAKRTP